MSALAEEFHEITSSDDINKTGNDVRHKVPYDKSHVHIWMCEAPTQQGVLTQDGITQIAFHKYHAGQNTFMDGLFNPMWAYLTECLPRKMAPNLVTLLGGGHCLAAYLLTWYFTMDFDATTTSTSTAAASAASALFVVVPCWVLFANAYCQMAYYTLDCMDGKQARRTKSSSPVGQLFDHGIDCLCLLAHLSSVHAYLGCGAGSSSSSGDAEADADMNLSFWFFATQASLQFSFFMAQWEEYYTGVLPHCCGQIGVTETNYGLAVASVVNGLLLQQERFASFYSKPLLSMILPAKPSSSTTTNTIRAILTRFVNVVLGVSTEALQELQVKQGVVIGWVLLMAGLILLCLQRVFLRCVYKEKQHGGFALFLSALSKLCTPLIVSLSPFLLPPNIYQERPGTMRFVHLSVGLCLALLTIKLIVFAMSRQAYAAIQGDGIPIVLAIVWIQNDARLTRHGIHLLFVLLTFWYLYRIASWTNAALTQLCQRLNIHLFSIATPPPPAPEAAPTVKHDKKKKKKTEQEAKLEI